MKILIVDDVYNFVKDATQRLCQEGLDVSGMVAGYKMKTLEGKVIADEDVLRLVNDAEVVFLDHNMPRMNGEELLAHWKEQGVDMANKRVVGISSDHQKYLKESFGAYKLSDAFAVKRFLNIS